jgi:glycosyltransferase involved in cell wall biosynthesis
MQSDGLELRVLLTVHHDLVTGTGAAGSTLALCEELRGRGHRVEVVGLELVGRRRGAVIDALLYPRVVARLVGARLARGDLDVVDASTGDLAYLAADRVRRAPAAVLTRSHGLEHLNAARRREGARTGELRLRRRFSVYHGGLRLWEVARSLRAADGVLLLNDAEAAYATSRLGVPAARIHRTAELLRALPAPGPVTERRDVLVLSPASWRKGADVAVRVLDAVLRADPDRTASWHGLADTAAVCGQLDRDVRSRVALGGSFDAMALATMLASHRVLLFPSRAEGLGMTVLEALTAGVPVVASDVPGPHDILAGGAGGVLVPDGHVEGMATALRRLLVDQDWRTELAERGRERAASYRTSTVVEHLESTYRAVLELKRA